jgi:uncharacterized protein YjbJ (UPF0337 family)
MKVNKDILKGKWHEHLGLVKQKWSKLTGDQLLGIEGDAEKLAGLLEQGYGYSKEEAREQINKFIASL